MKGLALHSAFFEECGKPLLEQAFPDELPQLAVGSVGFGSDRLGADDEASRDHCWEPGFQIFSDTVPRDRLNEIEALLFEKLPWEFRGFERTDCPGSPNGIRAWTVDEFFSSMTGFAHPPGKDRQWLLIADEALCEATNGAVFHDPSGEFSRRRTAFGYYPDNVWRCKLAGRAMRVDMERYSAERALAHGELLAVDLIVAEGVREVLHFVCLANRRYPCYDRWLPWFVRALPVLAGEVGPVIESMRQVNDAGERVALYGRIVQLCAEHVYATGLARRGKYWWADLRGMVTGDLQHLPPSWIGVEYRYSSQFGLGSDFRKLLRG